MQAENVDRIAVRLVDEMVNRVSPLADDPYIREALAKIVVRQTVHRVIERLGINAHDLADHLETMREVITEPGYGGAGSDE